MAAVVRGGGVEVGALVYQNTDFPHFPHNCLGPAYLSFLAPLPSDPSTHVTPPHPT